MMADELERGAHAAASEMELALDVQRRAARDATAQDVIDADGYLFCCPENLAALSGEMKEFFDRCYYPAFCAENVMGGGEGEAEKGEYTEISLLLGRPYALAIAAGSDGTAAARQAERICQGWRLRPVAESLVCQNGLVQTKANILSKKAAPPADMRGQLAELGGLVAATMLL